MDPIKTGKVTLEDIANLCGVSKASVSYVLSGKQGSHNISETTVRRILETAEQLNYRRDEAAAALAAMKKAPLSILVLSPWLYSQYSSFTVQVNSVLEAAPDVQAMYMNYSIGALKDVLKPSLCKKAHVILLMGTSPADEGWLIRNRQKFPNLVLLNRCVEDIPSVSGNDREATIALCERAKEKRQFSRQLIFHSKHPSSCEQARIDGFFEVFPHGEPLSLNDDPAAIFEKAVGRNEDGVFVFVPHYQAASLLLLRALRAGYAIPEKISLAAYDTHTLLVDYMPCELTTVDQETEKMTLSALQLARAIREGRQPDSVCIPARIISGETV